jgi:acetyl-CoA acyltransferase
MTRTAIVDGVRTPFVKAWTDFARLDALDLLNKAIAELVYRTGIDVNLIDEVIAGSVFCPPYYPNLARESVIALGLPKSIPGYTLTKACSSSLQAISCAADAILAKRYQVVIAGGSESTSNIPLLYSSKLVQSLMKLQKSKGVLGKLALLRKFPFKELFPKNPKINEYSTDLSMGEHAESMAKINMISREAQDQYALETHQKAAQALQKGYFDEETLTVYVGENCRPVRQDGCIRGDSTLEQLATLKPVYDKRYGTITAASASPLTDGASALLLMDEAKAKALGIPVKGYIRSHAYAALDPRGQMLLGNVHSIPKALDSARLTLAEMEVVEMHEAFAAQVLATLKVLPSKEYAQSVLQRKEAVGEIDPTRFNLNGGSIPLGHPFGATAGRVVLSCLNQLKRQNKQYGLVAVCAAGGMSGAMVLERE